MKNLNDNDIQSLLEDKISKNNPVLNTEQLKDYQLYQQLFEIAGTKPTDTLPVDFSKQVVLGIEHKQNVSNNIIYYGLIGVLALCGMVIAVNIFTSDFLSDLLHTVLKYKAILVFCVASFLLIQYFDKRFIRLLQP